MPRLTALCFALTVAVTAPTAGCDDGAQTGSPGLEPPHGSTPDAGSPSPIGSGAATGGRGQGSSTTTGSGGVPTTPPGPGDTMTEPPEASEGLDAGSEALADDPYFLGFWVIDQPSHALYEATLYEFVSGGALKIGPTELLGAEPWASFVTGSVTDAAMSVRCDFQGPWRSTDLRELQVESACTDGSPRTVTLAFPESDPAIGITPQSLTVRGESGWAHGGWPWQWRKCPSRADCMPF